MPLALSLDSVGLSHHDVRVAAAAAAARRVCRLQPPPHLCHRGLHLPPQQPVHRLPRPHRETGEGGFHGSNDCGMDQMQCCTSFLPTPLIRLADQSRSSNPQPPSPKRQLHLAVAVTQGAGGCGPHDPDDLQQRRQLRAAPANGAVVGGAQPGGACSAARTGIGLLYI